jgi:hypothetical protein
VARTLQNFRGVVKILPGLNGDLTPQARAVLRAFADAQTRAAGFVLSSGVFPEVSESGDERLLGIVRDLASRYLGQKRRERALRASLSRGARSTKARDRIEADLNALLASETTAAYVFGLAAGLSLTSIEDSLKR